GDVALVGHFKGDSSYYLRSVPAWEFLPAQGVSPLSATLVRGRYFSQGGWEGALELVPPAVGRFLGTFAGTPEYARLQAEARYLREYRAAWAGSPFPPVFVTTDAVVTRSGFVLLVRRGGQPGQGRLAMPGGFLDVSETLLASCTARVRAETGLGEGLLTAALRAQAVFDYPERSLRGRTITHALHFELGLGGLPALKGGPDTEGAFWMPLSEVLDQPELFFEDHHAIIEHFVLKG
ncbi:MAG: NUDIX domain-containing protein, partial [Deinococcus sp.]